MSVDVETLELEANQRLEEAQAAENDLIERLQSRGLINLWDKVRDKLHCERFLESRTGKLAINRLVGTIHEAQMEWLLCSDPTRPEMIESHRRATAAHMAIFSLDEVIGNGDEAQRELMQIEREMGE